MNTSPDTSSYSSFIQIARQRLFIGWLPIVGVALLILWLSGGIPPTALFLLFQMLDHWGALKVSLGSAISVPFIIILLQCIMIFVAWLLLGFAIRHEISIVSIIQAQQRVIQLQAVLASKQSSDALANNQYLQNTSGTQQQPAWQGKQNGITSVLPGNTGMHIASTENKDQYDPFDINMAVFELFPEPDIVKVDDAISVLTPEEEIKFVYGNPFEGELPDVFEYDMDLKREVQDVHEKLRLQKMQREDTELEDVNNEYK